MKFRPSYRKSAYLKYQDKHPTTTYVGANLTVAQRKIADKVTTSDAKYYIWCAGRQVGKSFTAVQILLWFALNRANSVNMFISMTYPQTLKVFKELYKGVKDAKIISSCNKSEHEIEFKNGSQIYFRSYQNPDTARGYHINGILVIDECAWMNDGDFESIFQPMLQNHKQSKCLLISSPRGTNWFHKYYLKGCKHTSAGLLNKNYLSFKTTFKDNPFCDLNEITEFEKTMPPMIYKQEILAEFVSNASSAFGDKYSKCIRENIHNKPMQGERYFIGIDVGRQHDFTVATVISQISGEVVEILKVRQMKFAEIAKMIVELALKWHPKSILCEVNGIGDVFYEMLMEELNKVGIYCLEPFTTTNQSKNNIVEALSIAFDEKSIWIPDDEELTDELNTFEVAYSTKSHSVTYAARNGCFDDMVMSLCIANWVRRTNAQSGVYGVA